MFLLLNGHELSGPDDTVFDLLLATARGDLADVRAVAARLAELAR